MTKVFGPVRNVPAGDVNMDCDWLFGAGEPDEALVRSIRERGLMQPLLADFSSGVPVLVAGTRRLRVLLRLDMPAPCLEVRASEPEAGFVYLESNAGREPDDAVRLAALGYFSRFLDRAALAERVCPLLGLDPRSGRAAGYLDLAGFEPAWIAHAEAGRLPVAAASEMARLGPEGRDALEPFFRDLSWSRSAAVNLAVRVFEAGRMLGVPPAEVVDLAGLDEVAALDLSPKDAMAEMGERVLSVRHPELARLEDAFGRASAPVRKAGFACARVDNFETDRVRIQGVFKSREAMARAGVNLAEAMRDPATARLFSLGEEDR